ncbi:PREDICTED: uncharacterized protein LOC105449509 [Wasmannia auropunctata]|uniref:uncharacterized protein LOC105449509 n=1 Tax=Wasmannia auropunctata TaxID=64793 RepID=UPI0005EFE579|nr:PREDICTED: uncharacterized protein LOC105449509 [Wasmannia auropunctata]
MTILDGKWMRAEEQHHALLSSHGAELQTHDYIVDDFIGEIEGTYIDQRARLLEIEQALTASSSLDESRLIKMEAAPSRRALPRIQLPQFSGKFEDWPAFRDLFRSIVSVEASLSKVEKLHYLKTSVKGDAEQLVRNLPTTEDNFDRAWSILAEHFENKRLLVRSYLTAFTSLPKMRPDSVDDLRRIFHGVVSTVGALEGIGRPITDCMDLFVHLVVELLDTKTRREWENSLGRSAVPPSYEELRDFLQEQLITQEVLRVVKVDSASPEKSEKSSRTTRAHHTKKRGSEPSRGCPACKQNHFVMMCEQYKRKTPQERRELVDTHQLCRNCLGRHPVEGCPSMKTCGKCGARHHTSLHEAFVTSSAAISGPGPAASVHVAKPPVECAQVLLATARVVLFDQHGVRHPVRALVDSGSETSMIAESLAQRLRLPRTPTSVAIFGIGGQQSGVSRGRVTFTLASRTAQTSFEMSALVFPRLTVYGGAIERVTRVWPHLEGLELADPEFLGHDAVELLLGADVFAHIMLPGLRRGGPLEPIAQQTQLGWIILGAAGTGHSTCAITSLQCSSADELSSLVRRFWEQEEAPLAPLPLSPDDQECEAHFARTHSRDATGRYQVRLPLRPSAPDLSATRRAAARLLSVMERRFSRDPDFRDRYHRFMVEYHELGHMSVASPLEAVTPGRVCYLPHHGVMKGEGSGAKIRVVFNGSSRVLSDTSLNAWLLAGPNLLPALADVLTRWRLHRYVLATDIEKMYRQILVHPDDRDLQRILWGGDAVGEYRLNTVTYGLACAPYLAIRTLHQLAEDEGKCFPLGAQALQRDTYVDDVLSGASTLDEALRLQQQLSRLCTAGGFPLRKWSANHDAVLQGCAKRSLLSGTARLFDPLGWLAPVTVRAKLLIQTTWLQHLEWDAPLGDEEAAAWATLERELPLLEEVQVPRWMHCDAPGTHVEFHGFSDASERAYAAVVYLRASDEDGVRTSLVLAKTKVAPLRQVSIPRLELCAAALLTKLVAHLRTTLALSTAPVHLWTDSTVTLGWIRGHPTKWTTYVANRVAEIQRAAPDARWHHVPGKDNPADCASRGMAPRELRSHTLWWRGPEFLGKDESQWPGDGVAAPRNREPEPDELVRFSSLARLLRVTAWMCRWRTRRVAKGAPAGTLTAEELDLALNRWVRVVQGSAFRAELEDVLAGRGVSHRSPLRRLTPIIDSDGALRVDGRLKHSTLSADQRHPKILPTESHLTHLIVDAIHRRTLHGGTQVTLATIRQRFWIPRGRQLVRRHIHRCIRCARWRAESPQPLMGSLPRPRVSPSRPFLHTGVDFAGPILLRTTKGRGYKAYKAFVSVFICFSTRAVHLEPVSDYSADAFLAAFRRFISRRGICQAVYSDCGTNFVGADSQLRALFKSSGPEMHRIVGRLTTDGIRWHFNPPAAPHFGGLWEAAVKSLKHHLRRVIGDTKLTFEEMATFLAEVEGCLNSRPLQALTDDPEDLDALTPGHFLIGGPLNAIPEPSLIDVPTNRLSRWRLLQALRDHLWQRWAQDSNLQCAAWIQLKERVHDRGGPQSDIRRTYVSLPSLSSG